MPTPRTPNENPASEALETLEKRAQTYRMLARLFFEPLTQGQIDALAQVDLGSLGGTADGAADDGRNDIMRYLRRRNTGTREELASDFTSVFYGITTYKGHSAMPYESLYRYDGGRLMGEPRGEVYRAFKRACVKVRAGLDVPEDHISFIFSFMALLCDRAAACLRDGDLAGARTLADQQREFFDEHVASWYPRFHALAGKLVKTRFYLGCMKMTRAFVESEPARIAALAGACADARAA